MIYLENNTDIQELYIPRQNTINVASTGIDLSQYLTSAETIELINETVDEVVDEKMDGYATEEWVENQGYLTEHQSLSAYSTTEETQQMISSATENFVTSGDVNTQISSALTGYATTGWVEEQGYLTEHQSLSAYSTTIEVEEMITSATENFVDSEQVESQIESALTGYATEEWVENQGYLTEHQSLSAYSTTQEVEQMISSAKTEVEAEIPTSNSGLTNDAGYVTSGDVATQVEAYGYATTGQIPDVSDFVTSGDVNTQITSALTDYSTTVEVEEMITSATENFVDFEQVESQIESALTGYATEEWVENQGYLTEHQSLSGLVADAKYITSAKTIDFYNLSGESIATIDATDFIKDGMVDSVVVSGNSLIISFNTDAGREDITIPLTDIFNPDNYYTKTDIDSLVTASTKDFVTSGDVQNQITSALTGYSTTSQVENMISGFTTSGDVQTQINDSISGIPTEFKTVNNQSIVGEGNIQIDGAIYSAGTNISISEQNVISVTGITIPDVSQFVTSGDVQTQINDSISGIPTDFKTINNQSIIGEGNIQIDGAIYSAGTNISIDSANTISVTGITVPANVSDLTNDAGYVTSGDVNTQISSALTGYATTGWVEEQEYLTSADIEDFVTSGEVATQIEEYGYITGYTETDPVFSASAASGITAQDISDWNNKQNALSAGTNIQISANTISVTGITIPDVSQFVTSGEVATQVEAYGYATTGQIPDVSDFVTSGDVKTQIEDYHYVTSADTQAQITAATSGLQETLVSGTNIKTINNQSLLGSGNITIQGGGGGGDNVVELTKAQYEALGTGYSQDTTYIITDADSVDLNDYALVSSVTSAVTDINTALDTKATKASVSAHNTRQFPVWNAEGIITGTTGNTLYEQSLNINGSSKTMLQATNSSFGTIYAPTTAGTQGQPLLSNGSGAPIWGTYKFQFISQSAYDAITTKDSSTIYFIISDL